MLATRYLTLLYTIADYRVLATSQIAALHFGSEQAARRANRVMASHGLLNVQFDRLGRRCGRPEQTFSLAPAAVQVLKDAGRLPPDLPSEDAQSITPKEMLDHQLGINWFRIDALRMVEVNSELEATLFASTSPFRYVIPGAMAALRMEVPSSDSATVPTNLFPDATMILTRKADRKSVLFFVEIDMDTEPATSPGGKPNDIRQKLLNYRICLVRKLYKGCEQIAAAPLTGFRVLLVTGTVERAALLCRLIEELAPMDFAWVTDIGSIQREGLAATIWVRGGRTDRGRESIVRRRTTPSP